MEQVSEFPLRLTAPPCVGTRCGFHPSGPHIQNVPFKGPGSWVRTFPACPRARSGGPEGNAHAAPKAVPPPLSLAFSETTLSQ